MNENLAPADISTRLSRRTLLGLIGGTIAAAGMSTAGLATGAPATPDGTAVGSVPRSKLGIQLWSCLASWEANGPETLEFIAQIGYEYVEFAFGYGSATQSDFSSSRIGMDAKGFRKALDAAGLWCNGGHGTSAYPYNDKAWKQYVEDNLIIGSKYLGANTTYPTTSSECMKYVEAVYKAHDVARSMGFTGSQFNHMESAQWNRLTDKPNVYAVEWIMRHTDPHVWNPELDTDHAMQPLGSVGAAIAMVRKWPGRWSLFHMKDGTPDVVLPDGTVEQGAPAEFGTGAWGLPDPSSPRKRPHAGFQDMLTAIRETQKWNDVLLIAESDQSMATCADYAELAYQGLNGLQFPYRRRP